MSTTLEEFVNACLDELQIGQRFVPYVEKAEEAGYPHLARLLRAVVASETIREATLRRGLPRHGAEQIALFVCPHCGLIYDYERPEKCPVDETPAEKLIAIE